MSPNHQSHSDHRRLRSALSQRACAFTLFEVMVATFLAALTLLGVIGTCIKASDLSADARHRDQARALLQSFASEFERLVIVDAATNITNPLFSITTVETGDGLTWTGGTATAAGLQLHLGGVASGPIATVTREVKDINENNGTLDPDTSTDVAGKMLMAIFRVHYRIKGQLKSESITIARTTT